MKPIRFLIALAALIIFASCDNIKKTVTVEDNFKGNHKLYSIRKDTLSNTPTYVAIVGNVARYMWQVNDSTNLMSTVPVNKIRVRFDEGVTEPYIKYRWGCHDGQGACPNMQNDIDARVVYVLLVCAKKDCPPELGMATSTTAAE